MVIRPNFHWRAYYESAAIPQGFCGHNAPGGARSDWPKEKHENDGTFWKGGVESAAGA